MPTTTVDAKVTYGSLVLGANSNYLIQSEYSLDLAYLDGSFSCELLLVGTSEANLISLEAALIAEFSEPRQRLLVEIGSTERWDFNPSDGSGFNQKPSARKVDGEDDSTGLTSRWRVGVTFQRPATETGKAGRADSQVQVSTGATGQRTVFISGSYTTLDGTSAVTRFEAAIGTYESTVLAAVDADATWETLSASHERDDDDKVVQFSRSYKERVGRQKASGGDHPSLKDVTCTVSQREVNEGASRPLKHPLEVFVNYSATLLTSVGASVQIKALYDSVVVPDVVARVRDVTSGGTIILIESTPNVNENTMVLTAVLRFRVYRENTVSYQAEYEDDVAAGWILTPLWNGEPFAREEELGPAAHTRIVTATQVRKVVTPALASANLIRISFVNGARFVCTRWLRRRSLLYIGVAPYKTLLEVLTEVEVWQRSEVVESNIQPVNTGDNNDVFNQLVPPVQPVQTGDVAGIIKVPGAELDG